MSQRQPENGLDFLELTSDGQILAAFPLMQELRPHLRPETFLQDIRRQQAAGYRLLAGFAQGRLVALAGVRDALTLLRGPHLFVDDLVTVAAERGRGYGRQMLQFIASHATERGFDAIHLDSRDTALGFYQRVGFDAQTSIPCRIAVERLRLRAQISE